MSSPRSARFPIDSAETGFLGLGVFFIKFSFLLGCLPERYQVVVLALGIFSDLENHRIQVALHPPNRPELFRHVRTAVQIIRTRPYFLGLFETNRALRILPQFVTLLEIEFKAHTDMI